jgi:hypothetical protein
MTAYNYRDPSRHQEPVAFLDPLDDPALYSHGRKLAREGTCGRGCCWTPFQVCSYRRLCKCHHSVHEVTLRDFIDEDGHPVPEDFEALAAAA